MTERTPHVVIIGGGIAGLATALALSEHARQHEARLNCTVIDRAPTWGGKIVTDHVEGMIVEGGPDSFLSVKPWGIELCQKLGLGNRLVPTNEEHNRTFAYSRGRLRELPQGLVTFLPSRMTALVASRLISWPGLLRMGMEWWVPPRPRTEPEESLAAFFRRRFGREAFDRLIEPLVAGIYAGDAEQLSLAATFPRFLELEQRYGSLVKSAVAQRTHASAGSPSGNRGQRPRTMFVSLRDGLGSLVDALVARLAANGVTLLSGRMVTSVMLETEGQRMHEVWLDEGTCVTADAVVLATPAYVTARLLRASAPHLASLLETIPYASTGTVSLAYREDEVRHRLHGFGFVVPRVENKSLIAATWSSCKWPDRSPAGTALLRGYVGGAGREDILERDDEALIHYVREELRSIAGVNAEPRFAKVYRWHRAMPQYTIGHLDRVRAIHEAVTSIRGLFVTGAAYEGVGIPDCIRSGMQTGRRVVDAVLQPAPIESRCGL